MKLPGGMIVVLMLAGCHYAPDRQEVSVEQKQAFREFNKQQAVYFDHMMDDLEEKMILAGAYTPGKPYEPKNIYPEGQTSLDSVSNSSLSSPPRRRGSSP